MVITDIILGMPFIGEQATARLFAMPEYQQARSISVYLSMPGEVVTESIVRECLTGSKSIDLYLLGFV
jgi:5-formyltetrahydrofolate cyclo-ligase